MQRTTSVILGVLVVVAVSGCWRSPQSVTPSRPVAARTTPEAAPPAENSYRTTTLAFDALGIGLIAASTAAYSQRGGDDPLAVGLLAAGALTMYSGPIIHGIHRQPLRAVASGALRSLFVSAGMIVGMEVGCARNPGWFCGFGPEVGWGMVGGYVVVGALDALLLHGSSSRTNWIPTMTPSEDGARVGIARTF